MAGTSADTITILSIDGGGVRGIIPGVILDFLESKLKEYGGVNTRLADYFDVISGTSTGGLIAAMISTPNDQKRPLYDANQIVPFYKRECPKIFKKKCIFCQSSYENCHSEDCHEMYLKMLSAAATSHGNENNKKVLLGSTYDGGYIQKLARDILGKKRLSNTLTNLVIPAYDIKKLSPVVFSSYEVDNGNEELDALLADICISTSAAPTYLPAYQFFNKSTEFNMIDGGVAANNPTAAAITEVVKKRAKVDLEKGKRKGKGKRKRGEEEESDLINSSRLLVLSLGTGAEKNVGKYSADVVNSWWTNVNWIQNPPLNFRTPDRPIIDFMSDANADMIDHYSTMFFDSSLHPENFLRIQDSKLPEELAAMDNADPANLVKLEQYAKDLLNKPVTSLNLATFQRIIVNENETYQVALGKFAKKLIAIKKSRAKKSSKISRLTRLRSGAVLK